VTQQTIGSVNACASVQITPVRSALKGMTAVRLVCIALIITVGQISQSGGTVTMPLHTATAVIKKWELIHTNFSSWTEKTLGSGRYEILTERKNDINMAKQMFKDNKAGHIAKHYKKQHAILSEKRNNGETEYLEFEDYA